MVGCFQANGASRRTDLHSKSATPREKAEVFREQSPLSSTQNSSGSAELRYARFSIAGLPGERHAVFVPDSFTLTPPVLAQVCRAIGVEVPSMLLCGVSSPCHPAQMSTPQLRRSPGFQRIMREAKSSLGIPVDEASPASFAAFCSLSPRHGDFEEGFGEEVHSRALVDIANRVLEQKLNSAVSNIANAAFRMNVWTLTGPRVSNFEMLLQQCILNGETDVFRLVIGHMQDKAYMESAMARSLLRDLFELSEAMSVESVQQFQTVQLQGDLWNPSRNHPHPEFSQHGFDHWSFDSWDHEMLKGHPITLWPWPYGNLFFFFYREEPSINSVAIGPDWTYRTKVRLDREAIPFLAEALAPLGYAFIGGRGSPMKKALLQALRLQKPLVILDNTPDAPKQVSLLLEAIGSVWARSPQAACRPFLADGARRSTSVQELLSAMVPEKLLEYVEQKFDSFGMDMEERLALPDVAGVLEMAQRRPRSFRDTVCVIDPLHQAEGSMFAQLMSVMTSHHTGVRDSNPGAVHRVLVLRGWELYLKLARQARWYGRLGAVLTAATAVVILLNTFLAVLMVDLHFREDFTAYLPQMNVKIIFTPLETMCFLSICLLLLPVSAGLLMTLQRQCKPSQKWAILYMTSSQVVSELYMFLGSVAPYAGEGVANRRRLQLCLKDLTESLARRGVRMRGVSEDSVDYEALEIDAASLQQRLQRELYGSSAASTTWRSQGAPLGGFGGDWSWTSLLSEGQEPRDITAPLSADAYVEARIGPLRRLYNEWAQSHAWLRMIFNVAFALFLSVAAVLAASGFSLWVPVALSLSTLASTLSHWLAPAEVYTSVSRALSALNDLDLRWQGSDLRENRSEATRRRLIVVTERHSLAVAGTLSRTMLIPNREHDGWGSLLKDRLEEGYQKELDSRCDGLPVPIVPQVLPFEPSSSQDPDM